MITGILADGIEAVVRLGVRGQRGKEIEVDAIVDTGFTECLSLPRSIVKALALTPTGLDEMALADDQVAQVESYKGAVSWNGQERRITVHCLEGTPLLGMSLLSGHRLTLDAIPNGPVTITTLTATSGPPATL